MTKFISRVSWGVVAWALGILVFYLTAGVCVAYFVLSQVAAQTSQIVTLFDNWWQTLLFVCDIVCGVGMLGSIALYVCKKIGMFSDGGAANE